MSTKTPARRPSLAVMLIIPLAAALVLTLFAWPQARMEPRDLPVGVAGPTAQVQQVERKLEAQDGAFEVHRYADEAQARDAIADRDIYGAIAVTPTGAKVLTATAASPTVAQMITNAAHQSQASAQGSTKVELQDVAPAGRVGALSAAILPLILAGTITALVSGFFASGGLRRAALVVLGALMVGPAATLIVQNWLDVIDGNWLANAGALSLTVLAVAATVAGLEALLGHAGTALGALTMILIGNPFAAVTTGPEMLPRPVGDLGQLLPPGAGGNLLRSTGYFDGAAAGGHIAVLATWAGAGIAAMLAATLVARRRTSSPAAPALARGAS
jgi:ABC-2 family transporter protein